MKAEGLASASVKGRVEAQPESWLLETGGKSCRAGAGLPLGSTRPH